MRVLFLSFYYEPDLCAGSFRATALISALKKKLPSGSSIDVITTLPNRYASFSENAEKDVQCGNVAIHRVALPSHKSGMLDQSKAFYFYSKEVLNHIKSRDYDVVFATSSRLMTASLGAYISKKRSIPLYLDIRDIFVDTLSNVLPRKLSWFFLPIFSSIEKWTMNRATHINLVSEGFELYFRSRYPKASLSFFSNGIDSEFLSADCNQDLCEDEKNKTVVLYAGNIGEGQGLHKIIPEFANKLSGQVEVVIIGDGGRKKQLQDSINENKVSNVTLVAPVSRAELLKFYCKSDVLFLHLNDYAAFEKVLPSKLFEYGALGKPILAGVSGYAANFVGEELTNAEVFSPCNAELAVKAFQQLELKNTSRKEFVSKYSREVLMEEMAKNMIDVWTGR